MTAAAGSAILGPLLGDAEAAALFDDAAVVAAMLRVEAALARAQEAAGLIPEGTAGAIAGAAAPDPAGLGAPTAKDGVPVPGFVRALRAGLDPTHAPWVHFGATSQDIADSGLALRLGSYADLADRRLHALTRALADLARDHRETVMAARTRNQLATPTSFGALAAQWGMPLVTHRSRLAAILPRAAQLSLHGASGNAAALGPAAADLRRAMAADLGLPCGTVSPHAARDGMVEFGQWCALVAGSLGKIGHDVLILSRGEIGELRPGAAGGSSTMPHKANAVGAEALLALAEFARGLAATLSAAMDSTHERDGSRWMLEWMTLPQLCVATAASLRHAQALITGLTVDAQAMGRTIAGSRGLMLAEAAVFILSRDRPRTEAEALVKAAVARVVAGTGTLAGELATDVPAIDWPSRLDPARHMGDAAQQADAFASAVAQQPEPRTG